MKSTNAQYFIALLLNFILGSTAMDGQVNKSTIDSLKNDIVNQLIDIKNKAGYCNKGCGYIQKVTLANEGFVISMKLNNNNLKRNDTLKFSDRITYIKRKYSNEENDNNFKLEEIHSSSGNLWLINLKSNDKDLKLKTLYDDWGLLQKYLGIDDNSLKYSYNKQQEEALLNEYKKMSLNHNEQYINAKLEEFKITYEKAQNEKNANLFTEEQRKHVVQANFARDEKNYANAIDLYLKVIEINPFSYPPAYYNTALLYAQTQKYNEAIFFMKKYLILEPNAEDARSIKDKIYEWEYILTKNK